MRIVIRWPQDYPTLSNKSGMQDIPTSICTYRYIQVYRNLRRIVASKTKLNPMPPQSNQRIDAAHSHKRNIDLCRSVVAVNNLLQIVKCCRQHNLIDTVVGTAATRPTDNSNNCSSNIKCNSITWQRVPCGMPQKKRERKFMGECKIFTSLKFI